MTVEVQTTGGRLAGEAGDGVLIFRGIPYARPPVGPLRFKPPQPAEPWEGVRDATEFGPIAPQNPSALEAVFGSRPMTKSEDCLTLNVWTPALDDARRPVLVWIHGGAFVGGSGSTPWYDGSAFVRRGDVVVVTLNYRLGALGFLHLADLLGDEFAGSGNAGILDQALALRWVGENIARFGGDPENVTIFGESAGGMSVGTLLALPAAWGRFHRAIPQSGAAQNAISREQAGEIAEALLGALDLTPERAAEIVDLPVERIMAAQVKVSERFRAGGMAFQPVVDGDTLPGRPIEAVAAGSAAGVSLLTGTNLDEMRLFTSFDPNALPSDETEALGRCETIFGSADRASTALAAYQRSRPEAGLGEAVTAILSDMVFRVPAARLAERQSRHQPQTWVYLFTWASSAFGGRLGSCHALEIPFVFNTLDAPGAPMFTGGSTPPAQTLADAMQDAWIAFARTGDPNHPGLPTWEPYDGERRSTMLFAEESVAEYNPHGEELALWEGLLT